MAKTQWGSFGHLRENSVSFYRFRSARQNFAVSPACSRVRRGGLGTRVSETLAYIVPSPRPLANKQQRAHNELLTSYTLLLTPPTASIAITSAVKLTCTNTYQPPA